MKTVIVRLVEPEQSGGELHGLVEEVGVAPVPFRGAEALLQLLTAVAARPTGPAPPQAGSPPAQAGGPVTPT